MPFFFDKAWSVAVPDLNPELELHHSASAHAPTWALARIGAQIKTMRETENKTTDNMEKDNYIVEIKAESFTYKLHKGYW